MKRNVPRRRQSRSRSECPGSGLASAPLARSLPRVADVPADIPEPVVQLRALILVEARRKGDDEGREVDVPAGQHLPRDADVRAGDVPRDFFHGVCDGGGALLGEIVGEPVSREIMGFEVCGQEALGHGHLLLVCSMYTRNDRYCKYLYTMKTRRSKLRGI